MLHRHAESFDNLEPEYFHPLDVAPLDGLFQAGFHPGHQLAEGGPVGKLEFRKGQHINAVKCV